MKITLNTILRILSILVLSAMIYTIVEERKQLKLMKSNMDVVQKQINEIDKFLNNNYIMDGIK